MKKLLAICMCVVMLFVCASCKPSSAANSPAPSSQTGSLSNSDSLTPTSQTKTLVFAEDDNTKAMFHFGMTRDQVKQVLTDNQLQLEPNDYGYSDEEILNQLGFRIIGGIDIGYDAESGLLNELIIFPTSDTEFFSPYATQKGLKIGDPVEMVTKLYGEPLEKNTIGDVVNDDLSTAYHYVLPINTSGYYKEYEQITGSHTYSNSAKKGAHLIIHTSLMKGDKFNRVESIVYYVGRAFD